MLSTSPLSIKHLSVLPHCSSQAYKENWLNTILLHTRNDSNSQSHSLTINRSCITNTHTDTESITYEAVEHGAGDAAGSAHGAKRAGTVARETRTLRTTARPTGKTILPSVKTSVCSSASHTSLSSAGRHTQRSRNKKTISFPNVPPTHSPAVLVAQMSSRIFQNDSRGSLCKDKEGEIHRCVRAEEREERVLPDAKLRLPSAACPPLTCTLALPLSLPLFFPALTLHRDFFDASLQLQQERQGTRRGGHLQTSHDLIPVKNCIRNNYRGQFSLQPGKSCHRILWKHLFDRNNINRFEKKFFAIVIPCK